MRSYVIAKSSRTPHKDGYSGPSCEHANVPYSKVYTDLLEAIGDSNKLSRVNPIGFLVYEVIPETFKEVSVSEILWERDRRIFKDV